MEQRCQEKLEMEQKIMGAGMFRKAATANDRHQALRAVLGLQTATPAAASSTATPAASRQDADENAEDVTPLDEVNELLARGDKERKSFEALDEKLLKPGKASGKDVSLLVRSGRLMKADEVP